MRVTCPLSRGQGRGAGGLKEAGTGIGPQPKTGKRVKENKKKTGKNCTKGILFFEPEDNFLKIDKFLWVSEYLINGYMFYKPKLQKICGDEKSGLEKCAHLGPR